MEVLHDNDSVHAHGLAVGDEIRYLPHECHALKPDAAGDYPWAIGRRTRDGKGVEEVTGQDLHLFLAAMRRRASVIARQSDGAMKDAASKALAKQIILLKPNKTWRAVVTAVNADGTVDLDIHGSNSATTLHCPRVPISDTRDCHHTCYREEMP